MTTFPRRPADVMVRPVRSVTLNGDTSTGSRSSWTTGPSPVGASAGLSDPPEQAPITMLRASRNPEPGTRNQEPGTRNPEPGTRNQEPGTRNQEPGTQNPEPRTRNQEPGTRNPESERLVITPQS